jgi:hypothetical protein
MIEQLALSQQFGEFERICAYWQRNHDRYLAHLRELAVAICRQRGEVTIDEVREQMTRFKVPFPNEIGADDRLFGGVLRCCKQFIACGSRTTTRVDWAKRVGVNRNQVTIYRLAEAT